MPVQPDGMLQGSLVFASQVLELQVITTPATPAQPLNDVWGSEMQSSLVGQALRNIHGPHLNLLNFSICSKYGNYWFKHSFLTLAEQ